MATVELDNVTKRFGAAVAADRASLAVGTGELVALLGPSGCGKTTLLRLIAGFEAPDAGTVRVAGEPVAGPRWVPPERRHVGMVFQDYALFPHLTVAENVGFGLPRRARAGRATEVLALVGLDGVGGRYPHELSGGQQQRVAVARALAPDPAIVLLDEPWSSIDPVLRSSMRDELAAILRAAGTTVLLVTHDQEEALALADRIALMRDGRIVQVDAPERLYHAPVDRWAAEFLGVANFVAGRVAAGRALTALGAFDAVRNGADGSCDVLIRPELLRLDANPSGDAVVVAREFRGHDVLYRVRLGDGTQLLSQRPSNEVVALGDRVDVSLQDGPVAVFPGPPTATLETA
ncbi:MAG TPA: ABC transporter ATP-binding protein [Solirubrobacteraceae bacterium]|nr:ABC transporter ATP-binding protein [Solirubrobacteraceae bacterium]